MVTDVRSCPSWSSTRGLVTPHAKVHAPPEVARFYSLSHLTFIFFVHIIADNSLYEPICI